MASGRRQKEKKEKKKKKKEKKEKKEKKQKKEKKGTRNASAPQQRGAAEEETAPPAAWSDDMQAEFEDYQREQAAAAVEGSSAAQQLAEEQEQQQEQQEQNFSAEGGEQQALQGQPPGQWTPELEEEFQKYKKEQAAGGHHPVFVGEAFKDGRYTALSFLGEGHYSTVWRVRDELSGEHCAMKVVRSAPDYAAAGRDEVALLSAIRGRDPLAQSHCVRLLDSFEHSVPGGGAHVCEVFELLGDDLLTLMRVFMLHGDRSTGGVPLPVVRHIAQQLLTALDFLHRECGIVHTDVKPENVMLAREVLGGGTPATTDGKVNLEDLQARLLRTECQLVDFGNATRLDSERLTNEIQTRPYRAPEVILEAGFGPPADIWSLGCLVFELATGQFLFRPRTVGTRARDRDHLIQMMRLLGHVPRRLVSASRRGPEFFNAQCQLWDAPRPPHWPLDKVLQEWHGLPEEEAMGLRDFLLGALCFDPAKRGTAAELLEHPWLRGELPQRPPRPPTQQWAAGPQAEAGRPSSVGLGSTDGSDS
ncbi:hypothetical protein COHA_002567 [Chlorella ohadii]|uniref:non-specific serine/threonine protein kinase n=1 Tax=Chlorella ohadii TaxID=2649997 RepID=A0AAD5H4L7_9CHLO|nr:hypothetical protein COHA_002567 [Chlorella ohadii]